MSLLTPLQLELAHAHLAPWLTPRSMCTVGEASANTLASMIAAGVPEMDRVGASGHAIAVILKISGFTPVEAEGGDIAYVRRGSQSQERMRGRKFAREWRERNKPVFDAIYGAGGVA